MSKPLAYTSAEAVTPSDATILEGVRGLLVINTGAQVVTVKTSEGDIVALGIVPSGTIIPLAVSQVRAATTATVIALK